jgi:VWFA-related protein
MQPAMSTWRRANWMFSLLLLGTLCRAGYAYGQTASPQLVPRTADERKAQYEAHRRITLAAVITEDSGVAVTGLKEKDFTVFENGISRPIFSVDEISKGDAPQVHGLIVVDGINGSASSLRRERKEIKEFLSHAKTLPFPVAIVAVSDGGVSEGAASTNPEAISRDLDMRTSDLQGHDCDSTQPGSDLGSRMGGGLQSTAQGASGWSEADCQIGQFNASMYALHQLFGLETKAQGRAIVIWLGPGWPIPPEKDRGQIMSGASSGRAAETITVLSADIVAGQVEFDAVSWGEFAHPKGVRRVDAAANIKMTSQTEQEAMLTIPALAEQSGGLTFARSKSFPDALGQLLSKGAPFYKIVFDPATTTTPDDFRTVLVKVTTPGVTVRTLHSYFEQP